MNLPSDPARTSWRDFAAPTIPLNRGEWTIFWIAAAVIALSRLFALSRSLWDWDEVLFSLGMRDFDVASHHPHPPGFPLFIATARVLRLITSSDFRALQGVNLLFACLLFPAVFLLARELRFRFTTAVAAGAICAFFPNVWFFGGTAFSDVSSISIVVLACAFLLRGCRSDGAFVGGTLLLAIAVGYRPQNFLIGLAPGLLASWFRIRAGKFRVVALAGLMGTAVVGATFWGAARATGSWEVYTQAIEGHREYIVKVDSFRNPDRAALYVLFNDFFVRNYQSAKIGNIVTIFVIISVIHCFFRKRINILLLLAFAPFCITAWLMLDHFSISRFSIGYAPLFALLIADGLAVSASRLAARLKVDAARLECVAGGAVVLTFLIWTLPAILVARSTVSPPMRAIQWIRQMLNPNGVRLYVAFGMLPYAQYYLPEYDLQSIMDERGVPVEPEGSKPSYLLVEGLTANAKGINFTRGRERLWKIARRRYFEVSIAPTSHSVRFLDGWYESENAGGAEVWRWMAGRAVTILPALPGPAELRLELQIPLDSLPSTPTVSLSVDGRLVDRFRGDQAFVTRTLKIEPLAGAKTRELIIETDTVVNPAKQGLAADERDLGLLLRSMSWGSEPGS